MSKLLLLLTLSFLTSATNKNIFDFYNIKCECEHNDIFSKKCINKANKNAFQNDEEEPFNPSEPVDGSSGSGLDDDQYLELIENSDGTYDLPADAVYDESVGYKLLSLVQPGDIMYDSVGLGSGGFGSGHIAFIEGIAYSENYKKYFIVTIEANPGHGVRRGYIDRIRFEDYKSILRVKNATQEVINDAIYFCQQQIGKPYDLSIWRKNTSIYSNEWYCSELVWAAYKYNENGIDLANGALLAVTPLDINSDSDTCKIMKYDCSTTFTINSTTHIYHCDGDDYNEPHNIRLNTSSVEQCTICNHIFWPTC